MSETDDATTEAAPAAAPAADRPRWLVALEAHRELVGTVSDRALARTAGVSASAARKYRAGLGLPEVRDVSVRIDLGVSNAGPSILERLPAHDPAPPAQSAPAEPADVVIERHSHRLGTLPDWMLARDLAVSVDDLRAWRERSGLAGADTPNDDGRPPPPRRKSVQEPQKPRNLAELLAPHAHLLGVLSDIQVAQRAGVRPSEVAEFRAQRGAAEEEELPPEPEPPAPVAETEPSPTTPKDTMTQDKSKKSRSRKPARPTGKKRGPASPIEKHAHLLGVLTDREVAARAGVTAAGVLKYRHRHGIGAAPRAADAPAEAATASRGEARRPPGRASKLDAFREHIGVQSDREVAVMAGLTANAVQMYRKKHGIPASGKRPARSGNGAPAPPLPRGPVGLAPPRPCRATAPSTAGS